ncbi:hypothetical protein PoMZ_01669 [Pyricularia oryzae]|uniref:Uncharacterized protein n=1 Tax=Pyricularia oryzae TaxID=318829 RepID=A0A4P7N9D2_PYROR|nr:hypothetical protein PoMZ_01669 [Pyricularia oryzae]
MFTVPDCYSKKRGLLEQKINLPPTLYIEYRVRYPRRPVDRSTLLGTRLMDMGKLVADGWTIK